MEELRRLFVASVIYEHNMRMVHWFSKGRHFDRIHSLSEDYAEKFHENKDKLAEMLMMIGSEPMSLPEILGYASNDAEHFPIANANDTDLEDGFHAFNVMLGHMIQLYDEAAHSDLPGDIISELQTQQYYFRLENNYKNNRRMMNESI